MKKILIIEDEITIAELEKDYLEFEGFSVEIACDGLKGIQMAENGDYDLIVLDLMLPGINGFEILKRVRAEQNIPMIMVSARTEDADKIRGLGLGADDYITKPFSPGEMVARVKSHLATYERLMGKEKRPETLHIRNLTVEPDARRVYLNDKEIALTATEYDLLYFLASNPNRVYSKEMLMDRIWGVDYYGDGATVTVHIGKLRDKIDKLGNQEESHFIETVWGAGYRFNLDSTCKTSK